MWCRPETPSPASVSATEERYQSLRLSEALDRSYDYPAACEELSVILRHGYPKLPKSLQALLFQDTLTAFRRLPEVLMSHGMSSAIVLLQSAEAVLPKQKRSLASAKFKKAAVAHKRLYKAHYEEGSVQVQLPQDVILDIFGFLDMRSLVTVSSVCWAWNSAASDNMLWWLQYARFFGKYGVSGSKEQTHREVQGNIDDVPYQNIENGDRTVVSWKELFKRKYLGDPSWISSKRALCDHCGLIIWLSSMTSYKANHCRKTGSGKGRIKPISSNQVVDYLFGKTSSANSESDSDSEDSTFRFWRFIDFSSSESDLDDTAKWPNDNRDTRMVI